MCGLILEVTCTTSGVLLPPRTVTHKTVALSGAQTRNSSWQSWLCACHLDSGLMIQVRATGECLWQRTVIWSLWQLQIGELQPRDIQFQNKPSTISKKWCPPPPKSIFHLQSHPACSWALAETGQQGTKLRTDSEKSHCEITHPPDYKPVCSGAF